MRTTLTRIGVALMFVGVFSVSRAHADTHFSLQIGAPFVAPPVVVQPAPGYYNDYYWVPAYQAWTGFGYRWVPGRWAHRDYRDHGRFERGGFDRGRFDRGQVDRGRAERGRNFDNGSRWHR
jgi:hypothetical protein